MEKRFNKYTIIYSIELILNVLLTVFFIYLFNVVKVGDSLEGAFNIEFTVLQYVFIMLILLFLFMALTTVFLILSAMNLKKYYYRRLIKLGTIILPVAFLLLLQFAGGFVLINNSHSGQASSEELCSDSKFEELQKQYIPTYLTYYNESNVLGKAVDLIQSANIPSNDTNGLKDSGYLLEYNDWKYECLFRKSSSSVIFNKFIKYDIDSNRNEYEIIETDEYIAYYSVFKNYKEYIMVIEAEDTYFYSYFNAYGLVGNSDYSLTDFIDDGLDNYRLWNEKDQ